MPRTRSILLFILVLLALDAVAVVLLRAPKTPRTRVDLEALRTGFTARVDAAARGPFLTTGRVYVTGTATLARDDLIIPSLDRRSISGDTLLVRVPGQVSYGFDITRLARDSVQLLPDGSVLVGVPPLTPARATTFLDKLDVRTRRGWMRVAQVQSALAPATRVRLDRALADAARQVLRTSRQPRMYSAHLLEGMLAPAARAAGEPRPRMRFRFAPAAPIPARASPSPPP